MHRRILQLHETNKTTRQTYEKIKLKGAMDWPRWNANLLEYMSMLRIKDILDENFDTDPPNDLEAELYNVQNVVLRTFVRNTVDHTHHHLINGLPHVKDQYSILQKHMDLGTHAQIYEAAKEFHTMKFNTVESTISAFNSFHNTITDAGLTTI
jgi:hypothetical protein